MATDVTTDDDEQSSAPKPQTRRADIQGLRGIAVILVVAFHADLPLPGGYVGVDAFFVISGVVITTLIWREIQSTGNLGFATFYSRRVRRLLPALGLLLVVVAIAATLFQSPLGAQQQTASAAVAAATFRANLHFAGSATGYFDPALNSNPLLHTWSLSVEEQFYLVFPLLLLVASRMSRRMSPRTSRRVGTAWIVSAVMLVSFALSWYMTRYNGAVGPIHNPAQFAFYSASTRAWEFGIGALLALVTFTKPRISPEIAIALGVIGAVLLGVSARFYTATTPFPGTAAILPVGGTALILLAGLCTTRGVTQVLATKPLVAIGDVSYGWYLWHWPFIVFARLMISDSTWVLTIAALASLVPTYLSYRFIERPIRIPSGRARQGALAIAAVCIVVPIVAGFALHTTAHVESRTAKMRNLAHQSRFHADVTNHCDSTALLVKRPPKCTWRAVNPVGSVLLLGDSNAGQFTEPVTAAAQADQFDATVATSSDCPFVDLILLRNGVPIEGCRRFVTTTIATVRKTRPQLVILGNWGSGYINNSIYSFRDPRTGKTVSSVAAKAAEWEAAYSSVLKQFSDAGVPTTVVQTIPLFPTWRLDQCPAIRVFNDVSRCGISRSRVSVLEQQIPSYTAEQHAVAGVTGATATNFNAQLCTAFECTTNQGAFFVYRDGSHLSVDGSLKLTPQFEALIKDHARVH